MRGEVDDKVEMIVGKQFVHQSLVGDIAFDEGERLPVPRQHLKPFFFQRDIVIVGDRVEADDMDAGKLLDQCFGKMAADEACGSSNQNRFLGKIDMCHAPMIHDGNCVVYNKHVDARAWSCLVGRRIMSEGTMGPK